MFLHCLQLLTMAQNKPLRWKSHQSIPFEYERSTVFIANLSQREFIAVYIDLYGGSAKQPSSILKYSVATNSWSTFAKMPNKVHQVAPHPSGSVFHENKLYFFGSASQRKSLIMADLDSSNVTSLDIDFLPEAPNGRGIIYADDSLHLFLNKSHYRWNQNEKRLDEIRVFKEFDHDISCPLLVYVPSKKCILLIGGYFEEEEYEEMESTSIEHIWRFWIDEQRWETVNGDTFDRGDFNTQAVLTPSQQHVIICGTDGENEDKI